MKARILFITYTQSNGGGAENVLTTLLNNLDTEKFDISLIEIEEYNARNEKIRSEIHKLPAMIRFGRKRDNDAIKHILYHHPEIIKNLQGIKNFDVVVSWDYQLPSYCLKAFPYARTISWYHSDLYYLDPAKGIEADYKRRLQLEAWKHADRIVAISNRCQKSMSDILPEFAEKTSIIHNPINLELIREQSEERIDSDLKDKISGKKIIVSIGSLDANKNQQLTIRSVAALHKRGVDCTLLILGKGKDEAMLRDLVSELDLTECVFFCGYQINPYKFIRAATVLAFSSKNEGWGMVVAEAMCLGKPFVTTPVAGASEELSDNGKCGIVADWTVESFSSAIETLLTDTTRYAAMSKNCLENISFYSIDHSMKNVEMLIESLPVEKQRPAVRRKGRWNAILFFAFAWTFHKYFGFKNAGHRFIKKTTLVNFAKLAYRSFLGTLNIIASPVLFITGLIVGIQRSKTHYV